MLNSAAAANSPATGSFEAAQYARRADLDEQSPHALQRIGTIARFARNETIFSESDKARFSYRVLKGAVRLSTVMLDGRRQIAQFLLPGDMFALDSAEEHSLTAEALTEVTLICFPRSQVERLSDDVPEVRREVMASLRRELAAAQHHVVMLGRQTAKERVASFLLQLAKRRKDTSGHVEFPMSRQDIADYLGLTIETVCRALTELKKLCVIATPDRHHAVIRNFDALEAIALGEA
jgi:CRP/FNR family nitrogen fixation transcriptional regulator